MTSTGTAKEAEILGPVHIGRKQGVVMVAYLTDWLEDGSIVLRSSMSVNTEVDEVMFLLEMGVFLLFSAVG
jgi:hypothetical protein